MAELAGAFGSLAEQAFLARRNRAAGRKRDNPNMIADSTIYQLHFKVASRCNLNCSYCYIYNKGDTTWKHRPAIMSDEVFEAALQRMRAHCNVTRQKLLLVGFHGGEPCLVGASRFDAWCRRAREVLHDIEDLPICIQTNGTLIDEAWAEVFQKNQVHVGVSVDGPKHVHDLLRIDHQGRGSYDDVARGIEILRDANIRFTCLCVIPLGADPLAVHRHFVTTLGCKQFTYLLPLFTHDTIGPIRELYGPTPCADFLIPIFDEWWFNDTTDISVGNFRNMIRLILGGRSEMETIGDTPPSYVFVQTNGEMEGMDTLRICRDGMSKMNLNVLDTGFEAILGADTIHRTSIFQGMPLPTGCRGCAERETCAGGFVPHRYSNSRGFDNPSVWCADLLKLFAHVRGRLEVTAEETSARRKALESGAGADSWEHFMQPVAS